MRCGSVRLASMRIVCDTNVLIRAAIRPGGLASELLTLIKSAHELVALPPLLAEVLLVMRRPRIQTLHRLDEQGIRRLVSRLYKVANLVQLPPLTVSIVRRDCKDDPILLTAVAGGANILATRDRHFFDTDVLTYAANHGIRIISDDSLINELRLLGNQ
jgi:putative PIN family toxin of toxin-antitoxin system